MDHRLSGQMSLIDWFQLTFMMIFVRYGFILRNYSDPHTRKWSCTTMGLFMAAVLTNTQFWHYFISNIFAIGLIKLSGPRYCHIVTFSVVFSYLILYRVMLYVRGEVTENVPYVIQAVAALNVIGVAIEINMAHKRKNGFAKTNYKWDSTEDDLLKLTPLDIFHYVFSYVVVCTGPYVRYQVYSDFIHLPYSRAVRRQMFLLNDSFFYPPLFILLFTILNEIWPLDYIFTLEFGKRIYLYRLSYCVIQWLRYRMFMYLSFSIVAIFSKIAGFGAYPVENRSMTAYGPTINNNNFRNVTYEQAKNMDLDMNTINIRDILEFEFSPTITEATRHWNKSIQYWLGVYIYKSIPKHYGRGVRIFLTLLVSTLWHGIHPTMLFSSIITCYYYMVEMHYSQLRINFTGRALRLFNLGLWISRTYFWAWSMMGYMLLDMDKTMLYYKSTYFTPMIFAAVMHSIYIYGIQPRMFKKKHNVDRTNSVNLSNENKEIN